jgi:hypothetical protein
MAFCSSSNNASDTRLMFANCSAHKAAYHSASRGASISLRTAKIAGGNNGITRSATAIECRPQ